MATVLRSERSASIGTGATTVGGYTAPSVTTGVVITGLIIANRSASTITVTVQIPTGTAVVLCNGATLLPGGSLILADDGNRIVLNSGDQVQVVSSLASSVDAIMSVAEIT
jgi:hypothetical protein